MLLRLDFEMVFIALREKLEQKRLSRSAGELYNPARQGVT